MKPEELPILSMSAVRARDKAAWLALFEEDAVVEDPVGGFPAWDPTGAGQRGREAIGRFYDTFAAGQEGMDFEVHHMIPCGSEAACFVTMTFHMKDGTSFSSKMINIYKMSPGGKIASLRSFWRIG